MYCADSSVSITHGVTPEVPLHFWCQRAYRRAHINVITQNRCLLPLLSVSKSFTEGNEEVLDGHSRTPTHRSLCPLGETGARSSTGASGPPLVLDTSLPALHSSSWAKGDGLLGLFLWGWGQGSLASVKRGQTQEAAGMCR